MRKIILKQHQSPGDVLVFTAAVKAIKETYPEWLIDVRTPCQEIFEGNPRLTKLDESDESVEIISLTNEMVNHSGMSGMHYCEGFVSEAENKLGVKIKRYGPDPVFKNEFQYYANFNNQTWWTLNQPEIWIRDEEKTWINHVESAFGYKGKFWLINAGYKPECPLKFYPYWQEVVYALRDHIQFVQIGAENHVHEELEGVFNLIGKTDLRQLIRLGYWAEGMLGPISFQMHLAAALRKPSVVVAGSKEPQRWECYPDHRYLAMNGTLECGMYDGCWKSKLEDCLSLTGGRPRCFTMIRPEDVANAVLSYYNGGRLKY